MTGTAPPPPPAFGQTVGEAQRALGGVLSGVLDQAGTTIDVLRAVTERARARRTSTSR